MIKILRNYLTVFNFLLLYKIKTIFNFAKNNKIISYFTVLLSTLLVTTTNFILFKFAQFSNNIIMNNSITNIMIILVLIFYFVSSYLTTQHTYNNITKFLINSGISRKRTNIVTNFSELLFKWIFFNLIIITTNIWILFNNSYKYLTFISSQFVKVLIITLFFQTINFFLKLVFKNKYNNYLNSVYILIMLVYYWKQIWIVNNIYSYLWYWFFCISFFWLVGLILNANKYYYNNKNKSHVSKNFQKYLKKSKLLSWWGINVNTFCRIVTNVTYNLLLWIYVTFIIFFKYLEHDTNKYFISLAIISICSENLILFATSRIQSIKYHSFKNHFTQNISYILLSKITVIIIPIIILMIKGYLALNEIIEFLFMSINLFYLSIIYPQTNIKNKTTISAIMLLIILMFILVSILLTFIGDRIKIPNVYEWIISILIIETGIIIITLPKQFKKYVYCLNKVDK